MAPFEIPSFVEVHRSTECHVTPNEIATRMVEYLGVDGSELILEPQAGTGNLIASLVEYGVSINNIVAVEKHYDLYQTLKLRFSSELCLHHECFLDYSTKYNQQMRFTRILTNPPFKYVAKHMDAAIKLLEKDTQHSAILVGLVPITYSHELAETLEELPSSTFPNTAVYTKLIRIEM